MNSRISMEHQLRYETERANLYAKILKNLLSAISTMAGEAKAITESEMELLDNDWRKVKEAGLITTEE